MAGQHCTWGDRKGGETEEDLWFVWYFAIELSLKIKLKHDVSLARQSLSLGIKQRSFLLSDLQNLVDTKLWDWVAFIKNFKQKALRSKCQVFRYFRDDVVPAATCPLNYHQLASHTAISMDSKTQDATFLYFIHRDHICSNRPYITVCILKCNRCYKEKEIAA